MLLPGNLGDSLVVLSEMSVLQTAADDIKDVIKKMPGKRRRTATLLRGGGSHAGAAGCRQPASEALGEIVVASARRNGATAFRPVPGMRNRQGRWNGWGGGGEAVATHASGQMQDASKHELALQDQAPSSSSEQDDAEMEYQEMPDEGAESSMLSTGASHARKSGLRKSPPRNSPAQESDEMQVDKLDDFPQLDSLTAWPD